MQRDRWELVEGLFHQTAGMTSSERRAYLEQNCSDPAIVSEVESLAQFAASDTHSIRNIVDKATEEVPEAMAGEKDLEGQRVGAYRLLQPLGQGGMGVVYLAQRADQEFEKTVAIKFLGSHLLDQFFKREREILARLEHPNIARLLDSGSVQLSKIGGPTQYIVMEYVKGTTLDSFCAKLNIPQRLAIFQQICSAVQYAHQNLVVHQDLKPTNILVDAQGVPKLLDFGIAKLLTSGSGDPTVFTTHALTPSYASPEQVRGEPASVAGDVYSLGVILYELLAGKRPYDVRTGALVDWATVICGEEPRKPSEAVPALKGDLDTIVLKALRKEPSARYASVQQLSDDLDRYTKGLPISARPATFSYRASKFIRRNRLLLAAATVALAALIAGVASTVYQARIAERRFAQVHTLSTRFLFDFYNKIDPLPGSTDAKETIVNTAREYLDTLSHESAGDTGLQLELADAYIKLGNVQGNPNSPNLGHMDAALKSYQNALAIAGKLSAKDPSNANARTLQTRSMMSIGQIYSQSGRLPEAIGILEKAKASAQLQGGMPLVGVRSALGDAYWHAEQPDKALLLFEANQEILDKQPASLDAATNLQRTGEVLRDLGKLDAAAQKMQAAITMEEKLQSADPFNSPVRRALMRSYYQLSIIMGDPEQANLGQPQQAIALTHKFRDLLSAAIAADPKDSRLPYDLATSYATEAIILQDSDPKASIVLYQKALAGYAALPESVRTQRVYVQAQVAQTEAQSSHPLRKLGQTQAALATLFRAEQKTRALVDAHPEEPSFGIILNSELSDIASIYDDLKDEAAAERTEKEALSVGLKVLATAPNSEPFNSVVAETYKGLGELAKARHDYNAACDYFAKSLELAKKFANTSAVDAEAAKSAQGRLDSCRTTH